MTIDAEMPNESSEKSQAQVTTGQRIAPIAAALMKCARTQEQGLEILQAVQQGGVAPLEISCSAEELELAYQRCVPIWERNQEKDIEELVQSVQQKSFSTMDADERFRRLHSKMGCKLRRGLLTPQVLSAAQARCHAYWSRVTPGNVATIVDKITGRCRQWENAKSKFDWIWSKGAWSADRRSVDLNGRSYTAEDLEQAERTCRSKFGLDPVVERHERRPRPAAVASPTAPTAPTATPTAADVPAAMSVGASQVPPGATLPEIPAKEASEAEPAPAPIEAKPTSRVSDFLAERVLSKCSSMDSAKKFFDWLREQASAGELVRGRPCTLQDVKEAEQRCKDVWVNQAKDSDKESSSSSSSSERENDKKTQAQDVGGVDELVDYVLKKTSNKSKIEKYFNGLFGKIGEKVRAVGRAMTQEELTEAWLRCSQPESKKPRAPKSRQATRNEESNADFMVHQVLRRCSTLDKAQHYINQLHQNVGKPNSSGRIFSLDEVTEAELRVLQFFEEGGGKESSSDSSSSSKPRGRGRPRKNKEELKKSKSKKDLKRKRTVNAEELEGALFGGSDSDELSGEESVDEEQAVSAEVLADLGEVNETALEDGYPVHHWEELAPDVHPGFEGFNRRATAVMIKAEVGQGHLQVTFDENAACPPLQPHQEAVSFLMHPKSPVKRLLVDHPTGSGKTREMIKVLDNYFFDPRAKIPIFPKDPVCRNFYAELLRWPSRYRDYYCCERPADAAIASGLPDWKGARNHLWDLSGFPEEEVRRLCFSIREVLEMKGMFFMGRVRRSLRSAFHRKHPGECMPAAPLRALGYTSAGGCFASIGRNGKPVSALMKIGYATGSGNVYCNKIVLMDEAHNLVRSQTQYADQLQRLRRLLYEAEKLVLAGFTGTPILSEPNEGRQLLDIIKGVKAPSGDEGFLSSFPMRPQPLFPVSLPRGLPDGALTLARQKQLVRRVEIRGEALKVYDLKRRLGLPGRRLRAYCNVSIFHAAFHDGRAGSKGRVLAYPEDCCPKLLQIAQAVVAEPLKAVIMIGRTSGYVVMLELIKRLAAKAEPPFQVATMNELSEFNHVSNLRGQIFRVLVADSLQCSEGVSFLSIRKTYLADVPVSPSGFIQQCGRSIRMYGHRGLPEEEQTVTTQLYVSMLPKWMRSSSLACWALRAQKKHTRGKEVEKRARVLTARMNRAGIHSLEELKSRLDAHGEAKQRSLGRMTKEGLTVEDVLTFLEQNGLWEEAKLLRNADKKDKEKAQAMEESMQSLGDSQLTRGNTLESLDRGNTLEEDDFTTALASMLEEAMGKDEMGDAERQQEMEAFKEEQDADDLDGEEKRKAAPPASNAAPSAPRRAASSSALDAAVAEPPAVRPMSSQEVVASLGEVLQALRAACREADKKPLLNDTTAEAQADAADTAAPSSEAMPTATAAAPADGAEDGSAGETSAVPNAESGALAAPVVEAGAPEALREPTSATGSPVAPVVFGEEPWRAPLVAALEKAQRDGSVAFQSARSAVASLDPEFKALTLHQVRCLRDEVVKVEKVETLRMAVSMIKEVKVMISDLQSVSVQAADAEPDADAPMPDRSAADAPVAAPDAAETAGETPVVPVPSTTVVVVKATISPEERQQKELQWRRHLGRAFRELKRSEHVRAALEVAAPGVLEKTVAAEAKVDVEKDPTIEEEEDSDLLSLGLGPEHVKRLHDELVRLLELAEKGAAKPRAMVRAMQMLYLADSASEAIASLKPETADEEALQQLSERTEEFAPALEAMRSLAVDRDVFSHLADEWVEEHGEVHHSESEASDLNKELGKKEPAPVVLPSGWRMEWVKRKKKEMREFVDHEGNRYRSVREVRAALLEYEARQAALQAAQKAAAEAAAAAAAAEVAPKRRRLRGKCSSAAYGLPGAAGVAQSMAAAAPARVAAAPEEDFAEELMKALGLPPDTPSKSSTAPPAPSSSATAGSKTPRTGCKVRILTEQPELQGKLARLGDLQASSWECFLESGGKVLCKAESFEILEEPNVAKRKAPDPPNAPVRRGRRPGRGRGQAPPAQLDESD